jgi:hypothetical protein
MKVYGGVDVKIHIFLTSALVEVSTSVPNFNCLAPVVHQLLPQTERIIIAVMLWFAYFWMV